MLLSEGSQAHKHESWPSCSWHRAQAKAWWQICCTSTARGRGPWGPLPGYPAACMLALPAQAGGPLSWVCSHLADSPAHWMNWRMNWMNHCVLVRTHWWHLWHRLESFLNKVWQLPTFTLRLNEPPGGLCVYSTAVNKWSPNSVKLSSFA